MSQDNQQPDSIEIRTRPDSASPILPKHTYPHRSPAKVVIPVVSWYLIASVAPHNTTSTCVSVPAAAPDTFVTSSRDALSRKLFKTRMRSCCPPPLPPSWGGSSFGDDDKHPLTVEASRGAPVLARPRGSDGSTSMPAPDFRWHSDRGSLFFIFLLSKRQVSSRRDRQHGSATKGEKPRLHQSCVPRRWRGVVVDTDIQVYRSWCPR